MDVEDDGIVRAKMRYECKYCHKQFEWKSTLISHLRIHTGEKPHSCLKCGKKFSHKSNFQKHLLMHKKRESSVCKFCGESFLSPNLLLAHTRMTHNENKMLKCSLCNEKFKHHLDFRNHVQRHSQVGPYKCTHCNKYFETQQLLDSHKWQLIKVNLNSERDKTQSTLPFSETPFSLPTTSQIDVPVQEQCSEIPTSSTGSSAQITLLSSQITSKTFTATNIVPEASKDISDRNKPLISTGRSPKTYITRQEIDTFKEWTTILQNFYSTRFVNPNQSYGNVIKMKENVISNHSQSTINATPTERTGAGDTHL